MYFDIMVRIWLYGGGGGYKGKYFIFLSVIIYDIGIIYM